MPIAAGRTACGLASLRFRRDNASSSGEAEICSPARRRMRKRQDIQYQTSLSTRVLVSCKPAIPKLACSNGRARPSPSPTPSIARQATPDNQPLEYDSRGPGPPVLCHDSCNECRLVSVVSSGKS
ncbi:hypothetical protein IG631_18492 [Alternaria alternata]|nr:hypothetical protein IG631_18492 [Alternaria alternata]